MKRRLQDEPDFFIGRYDRLTSDAARQVEREVLGHNVGLNGFTTLQEARALAAHLGLRRGDRLLDLGCGRGWPGSHIGAASGCRLYATDIPFNALREAKRNLVAAGSDGDSAVMAADGTFLPFPARTFDGIVHADVFC